MKVGADARGRQLPAAAVTGSPPVREANGCTQKKQIQMHQEDSDSKQKNNSSKQKN
ncbi:hypothetical protein [Methanimicrococcus stummii]|uniref:hypothetical protein n=1 Tax=Methanimicrococcus stummii TaxID=3028294 RepID=UPI002931DF47|nr:hypothetical protein [Methanimicrococcus sp. Es2]